MNFTRWMSIRVLPTRSLFLVPGFFFNWMCDLGDALMNTDSCEPCYNSRTLLYWRSPCHIRLPVNPLHVNY